MTWFSILAVLVVVTTTMGIGIGSPIQASVVKEDVGERSVDGDDGGSSGEGLFPRDPDDLPSIYSPLVLPYSDKYFKRTPFNSWGGKRTFNSWGGKRTFNSWGGKRGLSEEVGPRIYKLLDKLSFGGNGKREVADDGRSQNDQTARRSKSPLFSSWRG
jgi:hypothetical protein